MSTSSSSTINLRTVEKLSKDLLVKTFRPKLQNCGLKTFILGQLKGKNKILKTFFLPKICSCENCNFMFHLFFSPARYCRVKTLKDVAELTTSEI